MIGKAITSIDAFGDKFDFKIDNNLTHITSYMGTLLTVIFATLTSLFAYSKINVLINNSDITIMGSRDEGAFDHTYKFTADDGFFVAAALTEYDSNTEIIEEDKYGEMVMAYYGWGYGDSVSAGDKILSYHYCSDDELGLTRGPNSPYPLKESDYGSVEVWKKKFKCANPEDLKIWGDYNSVSAQQLTFQFRKCQDKTPSGDPCESDENIKAWLARKFIVLLYN